MGAFEHMIALVSFVLALAITHQLIGIVEIVRAGDRVRYSWVHACWMAYGFLNIIGWWIGFWDLHIIAHWTTWAVIFNVMATTTAYLYVAFVCPKIPETGPVDLAAFHDTNRKRYLSVAIVGNLFAAVTSLVYGGVYDVPGQTLEVVSMVVMLVATTVAYFFANIRIQRAMAVMALLGMMFFFAIGDPVLT